MSDPLINLRLLAKRKRTALADELTLFLDELEVKRQIPLTALPQEEPREAGHYAHLLHGRCAFINEHELERSLRRTEAAAAAGRWDEARRYGRETEQPLVALLIKLIPVGISIT